MPELQPTLRPACTICGRSSDSEEVIALQDALVCGQCKPHAVQRLREGLPLLPEDTPKLVFSAVTPEGKAVTESVTARTGVAAIALLRHRGYTQIVLHEDDASAAATKLFSRSTKSPNKRAEISAKDRVKLSRSRTIWPIVRLILRKAWLVIALTLLLILLGAEEIGAGLLVFILLVIAWATLPVAAYQRLLNALEWARWHEVGEAVRRIRFVNRLTPAKIPEFELVFREAEILSVQGDLPKALQLLAPFQQDPKVETWMYCNRIATLHALARDFDGQMRWLEEGARAAPESFAAQIDLAINTARRLHDPARARAQLDTAVALPSSDLLDYAVPLARGIIEYESGHFEAALEHLRAAEEEMARNLEAFFMPGFLRLSMTYRALSLAQLGHFAEARELYEFARPWLEAWRETELITAAESFLGMKTT